jgi:hypothetical protein
VSPFGLITVRPSSFSYHSIGMASEIGRTKGGLAVWGLYVHGADAPGRWLIINRRFVGVENASTGSRSGFRQGAPAAPPDVRTTSGLPFAPRAWEPTPSTIRVEVILETAFHFHPPRASIRSTSSTTTPCPRARRP